jgi:hypothetical protein
MRSERREILARTRLRQRDAHNAELRIFAQRSRCGFAKKFVTR